MIKQHQSLGIIILIILGGILFLIRDSGFPIFLGAAIAIVMVYIAAKMLNTVLS